MNTQDIQRLLVRAANEMGEPVTRIEATYRYQLIWTWEVVMRTTTGGLWRGMGTSVEIAIHDMLAAWRGRHS